MKDIRNYRKAFDILNAEGCILALYEPKRPETWGRALFLGSYLKNNMGYVYYPTERATLQGFAKGDLTIADLFARSSCPVYQVQYRRKYQFYAMEDILPNLAFADHYLYDFARGVCSIRFIESFG